MGVHTQQFTRLSLFSGGGGGCLSGALIGFRTVCYVEKDAYCQKVLVQRIKDKCIDDAPVWDDVTKFNGTPWRGLVDVITGGDPCQNASNARTHGKTPESLGDDFIRIIGEIQPKVIIRENPATTRKGATWPADRFKERLVSMGYAAEIISVKACCMGANHRRERLFVLGALADAGGKKLQGDVGKIMADAETQGSDSNSCRPSRWGSAPRVRRAPAGYPNRVDRTKALGNMQVPIVVAAAWSALNDGKIVTEIS